MEKTTYLQMFTESSLQLAAVLQGEELCKRGRGFRVGNPPPFPRRVTVEDTALTRSLLEQIQQHHHRSA